ncbi:MAG: dihydroorotase [Defluviitaleaceae bacterium]|nr:dihydroorotase [Defluviitaleaceae bacterium]
MIIIKEICYNPRKTGKLLVRNGRIIDPANNIDKIGDIFLENGIISAIGENLAATEGTEEIDAFGYWVVPGLIDLHVHFREPGFEHKEDLKSGSFAAALGGFTTVCAMANTKPVIDSADWIKYILEQSAKIGGTKIMPIGAVTQNLGGERLADLEGMAKAGACGFSDDGFSVRNAELFREALRIAKKLNLPIFSHCEDLNLGNSPKSESNFVERDIALAKEIGAHLHICHVSVTESLDYIQKAKKEGVKITAEVCPHHFALNSENIPKDIGNRANFKMSPPLRSREDMLAVQTALTHGIIDAIATDHAPHSVGEKASGYENAPNGVIGLETAVAVSITNLVQPGLITPLQLINHMSTIPARILGISDRGRLSVGSAADIAIIDAATPYTVNSSGFASKARNTPFEGQQVVGKIIYTILDGRIIVKNGKLFDVD